MCIRSTDRSLARIFWFRPSCGEHVSRELYCCVFLFSFEHFPVQRKYVAMSVIILNSIDYGRSKASKRAYKDMDAELDVGGLHGAPIKQSQNVGGKSAVPVAEEAPFIKSEMQPHLKSILKRSTHAVRTFTSTKHITFIDKPMIKLYERDSTKALRPTKERKSNGKKKPASSAASTQTPRPSDQLIVLSNVKSETRVVDHAGKRIKLQSESSTVYRSNGIQMRIQSSVRCSFSISYNA